MIAFIAYVSAVSLLLVTAAAASEPLLRAIRQPTRSVWLAAVLGAAIVALVILRAPHPAVRSATSGATIIGAPWTGAPSGTALLDYDGAAIERPPSGAIVLAREAEPTTRRVSSTPGPASLVATGCWLVASLGCLAWLLVGTRRMGQLSRSCRGGQLCGERVLVSEGAGPAVLGVLRYRIVIPAWVETLDEDTQRLILAHEREHVRARDPLALHAVLLLVTLMPWNIAFWFALRRLRAAIEIDCDTRVLRGQRPMMRDYCRLLIAVGERAIAASPPLLALAEPVTLLERRIESMTTSRTLWEWKTMVPAVGALVLLAGACRAPRPAIGPVEWPGGMTRRLSNARATSTPTTLLEAAAASLPGQPAVPRLSGQAVIASSNASPRSSHTAILPTVSPVPSEGAGMTDTTVRNEEALRRSAAEHQVRIDAIADSVISASYPELAHRPPGTPAFLALVLDDRGRVIRHAISLDAALPNDLAAIMLALHVDTISARTIGLGISDNNRWNVTVGHAVEALGPVRGRAEMRASMTSPRPYSLRQVPYQRIVDSVARARNPEAFQEHEGTFAVAIMLDEAGYVTRYGAEPHADLSMGSTRTPALMSRLIGDSTRTGDIVGVTSHLRPSKTVIVWGVRR